MNNQFVRIYMLETTRREDYKMSAVIKETNLLSNITNILTINTKAFSPQEYGINLDADVSQEKFYSVSLASDSQSSYFIDEKTFNDILGLAKPIFLNE